MYERHLLPSVFVMRVRRLAASVTVCGSAALLFVIQPVVAKTLLPRFGGSAGVWVASMMFFQVVLLLGYLYSFWLTRYAGPGLRSGIHVLLVAASLLVLPVRPAAGWSPGNPTLSILIALAASVGLPFFVLSTTSSLVQYWYAAWTGGRVPYRLFALSNAACLLALLAYPVVLEPAMAVTAQLRWWSAAYVAVAVLIAAGALDNRKSSFEEKEEAAEFRDAHSGAATNRPWLWIGLAACASALWLSVANYLSQEVAPVPFLWVLPLSLYLLSLVLCFESDRCYRPALFRWLLPAAWVAIGARIGMARGFGDLRTDILLMLAALFVLCMFCHGELVRSKPAARRSLAYFYLMVATGGALGGVFVGVVAPAMFSSFLELHVAVIVSVFLALVLLYGITSRTRLLRLGGLAIGAFIVAGSFHGGGTTVAASRNFYGALQIRDSGDGDAAIRALYNGRTVHGVEFLSPARRDLATAYYGTDSGVGVLLSAADSAPRRIAVVGLGAGTLASYGRRGDAFRFYEINPAVIEASRAHFHFLADSAASIDLIAGDGRLRLEDEPPHSLNAIVLDAFSDDAIPVHLLTREAFAAYFDRLRAGGRLAIHVTNRYLDLDPVVESLAAAFQKDVVRIHSSGDAARQTFSADWAIVIDRGDPAPNLRRSANSAPTTPGPLWTDDYSNLFQIWR